MFRLLPGQIKEHSQGERCRLVEGIVSHAGLALLRHREDKTGLTGGLSGALASGRVLVHDRGRVMADPTA